MIKRIVILNSGVFGKASIRLDDCNSIQLVGPNNIGKSTLIYTLNFLFIIDGKKMSFSGNRSEKDTLHHYFPNQTNSFLIFEIFKQRYYCILIKRGEDGLEYYKIDSDYKEELFLEFQNKQQKILKFEEVRTIILSKGIELRQFKDKKEVFNFVYQRGRRSNATVWLEDSVISDGLSNNFSKVYRYLINSKLINNRTLKDTLIIADNRDKEGINFSQKDRNDILNLLKANEEIKILESLKNEFYQFREIVSQFRGKDRIIRELIFAFNKQYFFSRSELEEKANEMRNQVDRITFNVNEELQPQLQKLDREIGGLDIQIVNIRETIENKQKQLDEINSFESRNFLQQVVENLDEQRKAIETKLTQINTLGLSIKQVDSKIISLTSQRDSKMREISNFSKRFIQNIAIKQETKEQINFILSDEFLSNLTTEDILKQISKVEEIMNLFDGKINIPTIIKSKSIASLEQLKEDVESLKKELNVYEEMRPIVLDVETNTSDLIKIVTEIENNKVKIKKIDSKAELEKVINKTKTEQKTKVEEKEDKEKKIKELVVDINLKTGQIKTLTEQKDSFEARLKTIKEQKLELEEIGLIPIEYDTIESLENIFIKVKQYSKQLVELKTNKDRLFDKLKEKVKSTLASEDEFIDFINEEIACLPDKRNSIDGYLQAISVQFANPAATLIRRYNEFKEFVYNKFNSKLSKTKFSDIESLKIELIESKSTLEELRKISSIQDLKNQSEFDFGQSDNLLILNKYLDSGKKIDFSELFEIELNLNKAGKERKVDLKDQIESDGTDRMIRLVIVMSVINRLAINDKDNKIVIFVDEIATIDGHNRRELFKFCKEHNFLPICASPDETILDGFDKYVLLFRPRKGNKVNINEKHPNVLFQEKVESYDAN